jgi:hypothetical protein
MKIKWLRGGEIGQLMIDGEFWGAIEWSPKRNAWCIEDTEGKCLTHTDHIHGQAAAKDSAIELAKTMIRDGRMPSPLKALKIMSAPTFALGVADVRARRPYHRDYEIWDGNGQCDYERGRIWAALAPRNVPLKRNGRINPDAVGWFGDDII